MHTLVAASMGVSNLLNCLTRALIKDTPSITVLERDENAQIDSNQTQIEQLLVTHGGQLRQRHIVTETGWSKSKVSRLLSKMEADQQLTKIRLGRENLVMLPGYEPGFLTATANIDEKRT